MFALTPSGVKFLSKQTKLPQFIDAVLIPSRQSVGVKLSKRKETEEYPIGL